MTSLFRMKDSILTGIYVEDSTYFQKLTALFLVYPSFLFRKSSNNGKNVNYISEDDLEFPKLIPIRA